jgi:hypothetical protein
MKKYLFSFYCSGILGLLMFCAGIYPCKAQDNKSAATRKQQYLDQRNKAINVPPAQFNLNEKSADTVVYGVAFDMIGMSGDTVISVISYQSGASDVYSDLNTKFRKKDPAELIEVAKSLVSSAQPCLKYATHTDSTPILSVQGFRFYLLTNKGKFVIEMNMGSRSNAFNNPECLPFFKNSRKIFDEFKPDFQK